ncbi:hypothetical protein SDC9_131911 [bioreactor metagenome]|uniref:Uncharacterized protein n=1 Tax=bioreactor metagenome TaxID=1076179 RepID=A0A645D6L0_9ZZZZ
MGHQADLLDDVADLASQFHRVHVLAVFSVDQNFTGGWFDHAVDHPHRGCFAAAARPDEYNELSVIECQVQRIHSNFPAWESFSKIFKFYHGFTS